MVVSLSVGPCEGPSGMRSARIVQRLDAGLVSARRPYPAVVGDVGNHLALVVDDVAAGERLQRRPASGAEIAVVDELADFLGGVGEVGDGNEALGGQKDFHGDRL